ncbi:MAG: MBL fold metallo-hydrolase [Geminicoccaceae bacterium]
MTEQVPLDPAARAAEAPTDDGTHQVAPDLAYRRLVMVNVAFVDAPSAGDGSWVLVDAGLPRTRQLIESAAAARFGDGARPAAILLTHGHFDHVGALEELATAWDVPVFAHALEHPYLDGSAGYPPGDPEVGGGLMARLAKLYPTAPVDVGDRLRPLPDDGSVPFLPGWCWLHTPGHSPGHVSFWREADRTLLSGDAVITTAQESAYATAVQAPEMHGPPRYFTVDWDAARRSAQDLAALHPALLVPGHGRAMQGPAMDAALQTLARDFDNVAAPKQGRYLDAPARAADGTAYRFHDRSGSGTA